MKQAFLGRVAIVGLAFMLASSLRPIVAREPTIDDRFREGGNQAEAELPLLGPGHSKLPRENAESAISSGPAYLGVTFSSDESSAIVRSVAPGSPAEQAGLQPRDVIETLQGIVISSPQEVLDIVAKMRPGTMLDIGVSRRVNVHAQAPLSVFPSGTTRSAGYAPNSSTEHELLPVPTNARRNASAAPQQPYRYTAPQGRSGSASGQPRNYNQNNRASESDRGLLGRVRRRG